MRIAGPGHVQPRIWRPCVGSTNVSHGDATPRWPATLEICDSVDLYETVHATVTSHEPPRRLDSCSLQRILVVGGTKISSRSNLPVNGLQSIHSYSTSIRVAPGLFVQSIMSGETPLAFVQLHTRRMDSNYVLVD